MTTILPDPSEYADYAPRPGTPVWEAFCDWRMLGTAGYATLLQVAHPTVGHGVHQYSSFTKDPWGRLLRTLDYVHGTIYGGPHLAGTIGKRVREMHRTIKGTKPDGETYNAMEPEAFAWVHATLALAIVEGRRWLAKPMTLAEKEAFYVQWLDVGRLIGVRERDLPRDWLGFESYVSEALVRDLEWTPAVPEVLDTLRHAQAPAVPGLSPRLWRALRGPLSWQVNLATVGMLPPVVRERLGLRMTRRQGAAFTAMTYGIKASGPVRVGPLKEFGPSYVRWRHKALARGDVAGGAVRSAPAALEQAA